MTNAAPKRVPLYDAVLRYIRKKRCSKNLICVSSVAARLPLYSNAGIDDDGRVTPSRKFDYRRSKVALDF